jgi:hypothetical protein
MSINSTPYSIAGISSFKHLTASGSEISLKKTEMKKFVLFTCLVGVVLGYPYVTRVINNMKIIDGVNVNR